MEEITKYSNCKFLDGWVEMWENEIISLFLIGQVWFNHKQLLVVVSHAIIGFNPAHFQQGFGLWLSFPLHNTHNFPLAICFFCLLDLFLSTVPMAQEAASAPGVNQSTFYTYSPNFSPHLSAHKDLDVSHSLFLH